MAGAVVSIPDTVLQYPALSGLSLGNLNSEWVDEAGNRHLQSRSPSQLALTGSCLARSGSSCMKLTVRPIDDAIWPIATYFVVKYS